MNTESKLIEISNIMSEISELAEQRKELDKGIIKGFEKLFEAMGVEDIPDYGFADMASDAVDCTLAEICKRYMRLSFSQLLNYTNKQKEI